MVSGGVGRAKGIGLKQTHQRCGVVTRDGLVQVAAAVLVEMFLTRNRVKYGGTKMLHLRFSLNTLPFIQDSSLVVRGEVPIVGT